MFYSPVPPKLMIDATFTDTIVMRQNTSRIIEIPFAASPMPSIKWTFNGASLPDPRRTTVETIRGMTALTISRAVKSDSGTYKLVIKNPHGEVKFEVNVIVKGWYGYM